MSLDGAHSQFHLSILELHDSKPAELICLTMLCGEKSCKKISFLSLLSKVPVALTPFTQHTF